MSAPQGYPSPQHAATTTTWPHSVGELRAGLPAGIAPGTPEAARLIDLSAQAAALLDRRLELMLQLSTAPRQTPFAWPLSSTILRDGRLYPDTFSPIAGPISPAGLDLSGSASAELFAVSQQAADILDERSRQLAVVLSRADVRPVPESHAAPGLAPAAPQPLRQPPLLPQTSSQPLPPTAPATAAHSQKSGIQVFLLVAGIVLISAAVLFFVTVAFREMNDGTRAAMIGALGVLALVMSAVFATSLRITAEGLAWLGFLILGVDAVYLARTALLDGVANPGIVLGLGLLIVALLAAVHASRARLLAGGLYASATTAVALGITVSGLLGDAPDYLWLTLPWAAAALTLVGAARLRHPAQRTISSIVALVSGFMLSIMALVQMAGNNVFQANTVGPALVPAAIALITWSIMAVALPRKGGERASAIHYFTVAGVWFTTATLPAIFADGSSDIGIFIVPAWLILLAAALFLTVQRGTTPHSGWRTFLIVLTALTAVAAVISALALARRSLIALASAVARMLSPTTDQWSVAEWTSIATYTVALLALLTVLSAVVIGAQTTSAFGRSYVTRLPDPSPPTAPRTTASLNWVPVALGSLTAIMASLLLASPAWTTLGLIFIAAVAAVWDSSLDDDPREPPGQPTQLPAADAGATPRRSHPHPTGLALTIVALVALTIAYATSFSSVTLWPVAASITVLGGGWLARVRLGATAPAPVRVVMSALITLFAYGALRHVGPWLEKVLGSSAAWPTLVSTIVILVLAVVSLTILAHSHPGRFARGEALTLFIVIAVLAGAATLDHAFVTSGASGWVSLGGLGALACAFLTVARARPLRIPFEATLGAAGFTQWLLAMTADAPRPVDLTTVIVGVALLVRGALDMGTDARLRSWPALATGLLFVFVPSFLVGLTEPELWRALALGTVALATLIAGLVLKWQAPLIAGGTMLILHSITQLWPYIRESYADFWYVWLAVVGAALVFVAAFYERSMRNVRAGVTRLRDLR